MKAAFLLLSALLVCAVVAEQRIPIPTSPEGVTVLTGNAQVRLEAYYDLACPDSAASQKTLYSIWDKLSDKINFTIHLFPLPYHYNSYVLNQGGQYFHDNFSTAEYVKFVNYMLQNQTKYYNDATVDMTKPQVKAQYAKEISENFAVSYNDFYTALNTRAVDLELRTAWKYGCSRTVTGTPLFYMNGVLIDGADQFTADQWISFLGQYVKFEQEAAAAEPDFNELIALFLAKM